MGISWCLLLPSGALLGAQRRISAAGRAVLAEPRQGSGAAASCLPDTQVGAQGVCARGERCGSEAKLRSVVMLLCRQGHSDRAAGTLLTQVFHTPCCLLVLAFHAAGRCFLTLTVVLCSLGCSVAAVAAQRAGQQNHCC